MDGLELGQDQVGGTVKVEQFEDKENVQVNYWTNTLIDWWIWACNLPVTSQFP